jgi:hypothetical protein
MIKKGRAMWSWKVQKRRSGVSTSDNVPNQDTVQESQSAELPLLAAIFSLERGVSFKLEGILLSDWPLISRSEGNLRGFENLSLDIKRLIIIKTA